MMSLAATEIPGKGRGLVAARDIKMGEQILTDKAVISLDCSCDCGNCDFTCCNLTPELTKRFVKQVDKMSDSDRNAFNELKSSTAWYDKKPCLRENVGQEDCLEELNIFFFNTRSSNLFLSIALINHSCSPNTEMGDFGWDSNEVDICELRAIKDISRGQEITTFYQRKLSRDVLETKAERQKTLIEDYGFQCRCEVCRGEIPDQDDIIKKIRNLRRSLGSTPREFHKMRRSDLQRDVRTLERIADLGQQLYIGRMMSQMIDNGHLVFAAQMARDSVSLEKGLQTLNKLAESSGLEEVKMRYDKIKKDVESWSEEFDPKKPPKKNKTYSFADFYKYY